MLGVAGRRRYLGGRWDESDPSPLLTREGVLAAGQAVGSSPGNPYLPVQSKMRRCILNDAGVVQYYLCATDSTLREDCATPANLDGTDGQVMVEIPKFYYKYSYDNPIHEWLVSLFWSPGFVVHPAFIKNGVEVDYRYIGAYEGVLYDVSTARYTNGLQLTAGNTTFTLITGVISRVVESHPFTMLEVGDKIVVAGTVNNNGTFTVTVAGDQAITVAEPLVNEGPVAATIETEKNWVADILSSVSAKAPINNGTRANFRAAAATRGAGWRQQDYDLVSAIQLLYVTEYASFYSQSVIGAGLTDWNTAWPGWNDYNPIETSGNSNGDGDATANVSGGNGVIGSYMSYRGIENFFGHIWKWVDGFNINNNIPYVSNDDTDFADDTAAGVGGTYSRLEDTGGAGITLPAVNNYQDKLEQIDRGFLPAHIGVAGSSSATYITDYYYQAAVWRVARLGGRAYNGGGAGCFYWDLHYASGYLNRYIGGRLCF